MIKNKIQEEHLIVCDGCKKTVEVNKYKLDSDGKTVVEMPDDWFEIGNRQVCSEKCLEKIVLEYTNELKEKAITTQKAKIEKIIIKKIEMKQINKKKGPIVFTKYESGSSSSPISIDQKEISGDKNA